MRFRFCGDLDCPDWVLAEMSPLSRLTSVKMKLLCQEVVKSLSGKPLDYEAVKKLTGDAKYDDNDREGAVAAITFVIRGSIRHNLLAGEGRGEGEEALILELTQLGLPKELAYAIAKAAAAGASKLQKQFREESLRLNHLEGAEWNAKAEDGKELGTVDSSENTLKLKIRGATTWSHCTEATSIHNIVLTPIMVPSLLQDLKRALSRMEER
ncbi:hypothetical protein J437_LFUL012287 [Ladona fulva]|uniref:COMM domain-containing protein 4 n=1 Tax=Ladona fulva TaxID=123851 RepID=A0A8K0KAZ0_LADFU|nr:hypothetical protein J437_LFUL012287 [Ladona fulva]